MKVLKCHNAMLNLDVPDAKLCKRKRVHPEWFVTDQVNILWQKDATRDDMDLFVAQVDEYISKTLNDIFNYHRRGRSYTCVLPVKILGDPAKLSVFFSNPGTKVTSVFVHYRNPNDKDQALELHRNLQTVHFRTDPDCTSNKVKDKRKNKSD